MNDGSKAIWITIPVLLLLLLSGCSKAAVAPPVWPTSDWVTSTPEEQGMDSNRLADMLEVVQSEEHAIDSVLVVRHGVLVTEAYRYPANAASRHIIHSCTKSIVSALIGIAIEQGHIDGLDTPILEIFADRQVANVDEHKMAMKLEDVLTMSTGLRCEDSYLYRWRGLQELRASDDWVQHVLDLPMSEEPGTRFEYCNSASFLLSAIIQETTGQSSLEFALENLFGPMGIEDVDWPTNPDGINIGWGELHMRPRDMAKIGYLYLHEGRWDGQQLVTESWVSQSTRKQVHAGTLQAGYGYQWWVASEDVTMALGYAGQYIVAVPDKDMVVVFTSSLAEQDFYLPWDLIREHVFPAVISERPLPADPAGVSRLKQAIDGLGRS